MKVNAITKNGQPARIKKCKECGFDKPHRKIDKGYNRVEGAARVWAVICEDCASKPEPTCPHGKMTTYFHCAECGII